MESGDEDWGVTATDDEASCSLLHHVMRFECEYMSSFASKCCCRDGYVKYVMRVENRTGDTKSAICPAPTSLVSFTQNLSPVSMFSI